MTVDILPFKWRITNKADKQENPKRWLPHRHHWVIQGDIYQVHVICNSPEGCEQEETYHVILHFLVDLQSQCYQLH